MSRISYLKFGCYKEINDFINNDKSDCIVYIAFGHAVNYNFAPSHLLDTFINSMNNLSHYRFIWSYNGPDISNRINENIRLVRWAPQKAILNHQRTRLFISHGGMKR